MHKTLQIYTFIKERRMTPFYIMFRSCFIPLLLIIMKEIIGNNAAEFLETNDGKRRDVSIISVNSTPYADSTENFPTINKGKASEDIEQTRVKIGVQKMLELVSGMLSHDTEFHAIDFLKIHKNQIKNLSNISENNTIHEINTDATENFPTISAGNTTDDMEKYKLNKTESMEEPKFKFSDLLERFKMAVQNSSTMQWLIGIVVVFVLFCVLALILQIRACMH